MLHLEPKHTMDEYLELLKVNKQICIDHERLTRATVDANYRIQDHGNIAIMYLKIFSGGDYRTTSTDDLIDFLIDNGVSEKRFEVKGRKSLSFDLKKVVEPLLKAGVFPEILEPYSTMRSFVSYRNFLTKQLLNNPNVKYVRRNDGVLLRKYNFSVREMENLRAYYSDIAVVNIPKIYSDIITVPDTDYIMVWCDYPQADWRMAYNLFLRDESNAHIMDRYEDSYKGAAVLVEGDEFSEDDFVHRRKDYKVDTLKTFYNSRDGGNLTTKLRDFFMSCPKYRKYYNDLSALYELKLPVPCTSYFGFNQMLPEGLYRDAFISKGLNTPIQTMTSHLVIETVFGIIERFKALGYSDEDSILPYFVRHDEPVFLIRKNLLKDAWVFGDCSEIHIDGFSPIKLDFHFGYNYLEEDETIAKYVETVCSKNTDKYSVYEKGNMNTSWNPIPSVLSGYADIVIRDGVPYAAFYLEGGTVFKMYAVSTKIYEEAIVEGITALLAKYSDIRYLILDNVSVSNVYKDSNCLVYLKQYYDSEVTRKIHELVTMEIKGGDS